MERKIIKVIKYILLPLLVVLVPVYWFVFYLLKLIKTKKQKKFDGIKVVCVGNHTLGGTGKTTVVKKLVEELVAKNKTVGVVTRGYKRKNKKTVIILQPEKIVDNEFVHYTGDEPFMLFRSLNVPIAVSSNRVEAIQKLCESSKVDIIISDDGYQNFSFYKNVNILVINLYEISKKLKLLFPLGCLREKLSSALKRADYVILNHSRCVSYKVVSEILNNIKKINKDIKIIRTYYRVKNFFNLYTQKTYLPNEFLLLHFNISVACGIGEPNLFVRMLETNGLDVKYKFFYPDHYWYTVKDLRYWRKISNYPVVVTYKDMVKLYPLVHKLEKMYVNKIYCCNIELEIEEGKDVWLQLVNSL